MEDLLAPLAGETAGKLARGLIARYGGLSLALRAEPEATDLADDEREALRLISAAREIIRAACAETLVGSQVDTRDAALTDYLRLTLAFSGEEHLLVIFVDSQGGYVGEEVFTGGGCGAHVLPMRHIARRSLDLGARALLLAHNHPSGCEQPSTADVIVTKALSDVLNAIEVELLDHLIVTRRTVFSLKAGGRL